MTRFLTLPPHLPVPELERRYRGARDPVARSHYQIIWLLAQATPTAEVARVTGYSVTWVREVARRYRVDGPSGLGDRRHGNPGATPLLTPAQQAALQAALAGPAPDGGIWTCRKVAAWIAAAIGRPVAEVRGWEWMRRLGFTPQRPRPRDTRADPITQAAFTKGGSKPPSMPSPRPILPPR
jgi:transposase